MSTGGPPVRLGLVGAGPWAEVLLDQLVRHPAVEVVGVWARRPEAAAELADPRGVPAVAELDGLMAAAEALAICVPPHVQPEIAESAARRGLHLMLEKPIAADVPTARGLTAACEEAGVVTQVMLTRRFASVTRSFLAECAAEMPVDQVDGVTARYVHGAFLGGPFATEWRLREGVLLDLGPHLFDLVEQVAGPIVDLRAVATDRHALAVTTFHEHGAIGQLMLSGHSAGEESQEIVAFGQTGKHRFDAAEVDGEEAFRVAIDEFAASVRTGSPVVADVRRGLELQLLLEQAAAQLR